MELSKIWKVHPEGQIPLQDNWLRGPTSNLFHPQQSLTVPEYNQQYSSQRPLQLEATQSLSQF